MLFNQISQIDDQTSINQFGQLTFSINQIRNISTRSHQGDFALAAASAYIKFRLQSNAGFLSNYFTDFILHSVPVRAGIPAKEGEADWTYIFSRRCILTIIPCVVTCVVACFTVIAGISTARYEQCACKQQSSKSFWTFPLHIYVPPKKLLKSFIIV
ncbi:hypothetical protein D3C73_1048600 [compost metagenome]